MILTISRIFKILFLAGSCHLTQLCAAAVTAALAAGFGNAAAVLALLLLLCFSQEEGHFFANLSSHVAQLHTTFVFHTYVHS